MRYKDRTVGHRNVGHSHSYSMQIGLETRRVVLPVVLIKLNMCCMILELPNLDGRLARALISVKSFRGRLLYSSMDLSTASQLNHVNF